MDGRKRRWALPPSVMLSPQHMPSILRIRSALRLGPLLNWMVHRLLHYFSIAALHSRLKAHYLSDWDHRNLLHVWPLKAFSLWWISGENLLESIFYLVAQGRAQKWNEPVNGPVLSGTFTYKKNPVCQLDMDRIYKMPQMPPCLFSETN